MDEKSRELIMLLAGGELSEEEQRYFKSELNENVDLCQIFLTAVACRKYEQAKDIIDIGWNINDINIMSDELVICANFESSMEYIDIYISMGLIITEELLNRVIEIAIENREYFETEKTERVIEQLKSRIFK